MSRPYLKPNWMRRNVANRLVPRLAPKVVGRITVTGRRTGRPHTTAVSPFRHEADTYVVSVFGVADWALDLREAGRCRIRLGRTSTDYAATEVPVEERPPILKGYREAFSRYPGVDAAFDTFPDPAAHPTFRLTSLAD
jgi:deazaflavin-dependent oxidoreductase (nitroreductase family)